MTTIASAANRTLATDKQIDDYLKVYRDLLLENRHRLEPGAMEKINLSQKYEGVELLCARVEAVSEFIVRLAKVKRGRTPRKALEATGRICNLDDRALESMPPGEGDEVWVHFFRIGRRINHSELEKEFGLRGLKPDPYAQAQIHADDPSFADGRPNATYWKDLFGNLHALDFFEWNGNRSLTACSNQADWEKNQLFAGVLK